MAIRIESLRRLKVSVHDVRPAPRDRMHRFLLKLIALITAAAPLVAGDIRSAGVCGSQAGQRELALAVRVLTPTARLVQGLDAGNFTLKDGRRPLAICGVTHDLQPVSLGILVDNSASMMGTAKNLPRVTREALTTLLDIARVDDEFFLEYVTDVAHMQCLFTCDRRRIRDSVMVNPNGKTALIDGVYLAVQGMTKAQHANRAIVLVSDGGDNDSLYKINELEKAIAERPVPLFMVVPWSIPDTLAPKPYIGEAEINISNLIRRTGGYSITAVSEAEAKAAMARIAVVVRSPYMLHFAIPQSCDVKSLRRLKVSVHGVRPAPRVFYGIAYDAKTGESFGLW